MFSSIFGRTSTNTKNHIEGITPSVEIADPPRAEAFRVPGRKEKFCRRASAIKSQSEFDFDLVADETLIGSVVTLDDSSNWCLSFPFPQRSTLKQGICRGIDSASQAERKLINAYITYDEIRKQERRAEKSITLHDEGEATDAVETLFKGRTLTDIPVIERLNWPVAAFGHNSCIGRIETTVAALSSISRDDVRVGDLCALSETRFWVRCGGKKTMATVRAIYSKTGLNWACIDPEKWKTERTPKDMGFLDF